MKQKIVSHWKKILLGGIAVFTISIGCLLIYVNQVVYIDSNKVNISETQAIELFNKTFNNKKIQSIELEPSICGYIYQVEGFDDTNEYTIKVNAETGKILRKKTDRLDSEDKYETFGLTDKKLLTWQEASEIAKSASVIGTSKEWRLEQVSDSTSIWKVKIRNGFFESEVTIDALTGGILEIDSDN